MITMFDEDAARSRSHGLRPELVAAQADRLGLRRVIGRCTWPTYDAAFGEALRQVKDDGVTHVIFGDILFDEHRAWANARCAEHGLMAVEPLFGSSTHTLFREWIESGADALIVTARAAFLDESWLGRRLGLEMLEDFDRLGVDPCGERGEYHTAVTNSPLFSAPLDVVHGERVLRSGCHALDLALATGGLPPSPSGFGEPRCSSLDVPASGGGTAGAGRSTDVIQTLSAPRTC